MIRRAPANATRSISGTRAAQMAARPEPDRDAGSTEDRSTTTPAPVIAAGTDGAVASDAARTPVTATTTTYAAVNRVDRGRHRPVAFTVADVFGVGTMARDGVSHAVAHPPRHPRTHRP